MKLFAVLKRYSRTRTVVLAVITGGLSGGASSALLYLINLSLYNQAQSVLVRYASLFVALCFVAVVGRVVSAIILANLGARASAVLQTELSRRILRAPLSRLEEVGPHRLLASLTDDVYAVSDALGNVPLLLVNVAVVVGCLVYMAVISVPLLVATLITMVLGIAGYQIAQTLGARKMTLARDLEDELFQHFRGVTQGTKELKIRRSRRHAFLGLLERTTDSFRELRVAAMKYFILAANWGNLLFFIVIGMILYLTPRLYPVGPEKQSGFIIILLYLVSPLQLALNAVPILTRAGVAVSKIDRLGISLVEGPQEPEADGAFELDWQSLELRQVTYDYPGEEDGSRFTLGPLSFSLRPGELVFLVGGNGSGKTTLAKLVLGLYVPQGGEIYFDGQPITDANRDELRQKLAVVFSDFYLFDQLLGFGGADLDEKARHYLAQLHLKHKVRVQDGKLSTIDLSQGQRKRLALLVAYLDDCPILVFDEWAADQDPEFKKVFYHHLLPELKARKKAVLVISHDDSYYGVADRIVKLDYGKLVDAVD